MRGPATLLVEAAPEEPLPPAGRILQTIEERPGLSIREITDHVPFCRSTVRYHIDRLTADGLVAIQRQGNHRLHFAMSVPPMRRRAIALLRVGSLRSIVDAVLQPESGSSPQDRPFGPTILFRTGAVADETGISVRSVYRGVKVLERAGLAEAASAPRGACVLSIHPELRIAWVFYAKNATRAPRPLRAAPAWLLFFELLVGKMAIGGWAAS